jgi:hypothetical protein
MNAAGDLNCWIFNDPVINSVVQVPNVPRVWRNPRSRLRAAAAGGAWCAKRTAKRAFCHGTVKNQQRSAPEVL